jgi:hypothetical protein
VLLTLDVLLAAAAVVFGTVVRRRVRSIAPRPAGMYGLVTVDRSKITPDMHVPALDGTGHHGDYECGHIASTLFKRAVQTGALNAPAGVQIACYPDRDIVGGGFVLVAYPDGDGSAWGTTTGYYAADVIGTIEKSETNDSGTVAQALEVFARDLNTSLAGLEAHVRHTRSRPLADRVWPRRRQSQTSGSPTYLLAVKDAEEGLELILQHATVAPEYEVSGLIAAVACLLSLDERDAGSIVDQARRNG